VVPVAENTLHDHHGKQSGEFQPTPLTAMAMLVVGTSSLWIRTSEATKVGMGCELSQNRARLETDIMFCVNSMVFADK
jgi:hypothetical protein